MALRNGIKYLIYKFRMVANPVWVRYAFQQLTFYHNSNILLKIELHSTVVGGDGDGNGNGDGDESSLTTVLLQCNNQRINMEKAIRSNNNFNI